MEATTIDKDIPVMVITATSFPDGVQRAHMSLHALVPQDGTRRYYGLSRMEDDKIVYHAAVEQLEDGEAANLGLKNLVIRRGSYVSERLNDFMNNIPAIGETFQEMIRMPGIDPQGYCVEWYETNKDMYCMVRLKD